MTTDDAAAAMFEQLSDEDLAKLISDLEAIQATRTATAQQSQVEHEPGAGGQEEGT